LKPQFRLTAHRVSGPWRNVTYTRSALAPTPDRFSFPKAGSTLLYIWAIGNESQPLRAHVYNAPAQLTVGSMP